MQRRWVTQLRGPPEQRVAAHRRSACFALGVPFAVSDHFAQGSAGALELARTVERVGLSALPVCIAKTHSSLTDDPKAYGRPRDFDVTVRGVQINAGAGFLVVLTGEILRMPGLPKRPLAEGVDLRDGKITGLA
jgi:formyltetrahydrofolate synthetase